MAEIRFGHEVINVDVESKQPILTVKDEQEQVYQIQAKFLLDASGFGRILPKFLDLESPSDFPVRRARFTHIEDGIFDDVDFDREKSWLRYMPKISVLGIGWFLFADNVVLFGVVAEQDFFAHYGFDAQQDIDLDALLKRI